MIPYFNIVIYLVFCIVGLIIGIIISKKIKIKFSLTGDPLTDAAYFIVMFSSIVLALIIVMNVILLHFQLEIPHFIETTVVDVLRAYGPIFLGAVTIFISRREKREEKKEIVSEKIASPLYLEIDKIQEDLLGEHPLVQPTAKRYFEKWEGIKGTKYEIESLKIDEFIDDFYKNVQNYIRSLEQIGSNINYRINSSFNDIVLSKKDVDYDMDIELVEPFIVYFWSSMHWNKLTLYKHIILGINSIEWAKSQDKNLLDDRIKVKIVSIFEQGRPLSEDEVEFNYKNIKDDFDAFISYMEKLMSELDYVKEIRQLRQDLLLESDRLLDSLSDYV